MDLMKIIRELIGIYRNMFFYDMIRYVYDVVYLD